MFYLLQWKPFKNDEKCFLFHLKSCFSSHIKKRPDIRLISKFMTSQPGSQSVAIQILLNISRNKSNQAMKFRQLIKYNNGNTFLEKSCRKLGRKTSSRPAFVFLKKLSMSQKQRVCSLPSIYLDSLQLGIQLKQTLKNFKLLIQRNAQFQFLRRGVWG